MKVYEKIAYIYIYIYIYKYIYQKIKKQKNRKPKYQHTKSKKSNKLHIPNLFFCDAKHKKYTKKIIQMVFNTKPTNIHFRWSINCHVTLNNYYLNVNNFIS